VALTQIPLPLKYNQNKIEYQPVFMRKNWPGADFMVIQVVFQGAK